MTLHSCGPLGRAAPTLEEIDRIVRAFAPDGLEPWEEGYLRSHGRRFQDTLALLGDGAGRRLLDVGTFPGHLAALARARGWAVEGLNSDIESGTSYERFLERCAAQGIAMHACEVERDRFPLGDASFDAVLFAELFEHLCFNPFHTLREIFRVLRPGGVLVLTTPNLRRLDALARLLHGWGCQPPVSRTFSELLPSLLHHRHNREYTGNELVYFLSLQGKDLYDFAIERLCYSDCHDAGLEVPGVLGQAPGKAEWAAGRLLRRAIPSLCGQIMVRAVRSAAVFQPWDGLARLDGLGPPREDELPHRGYTRRVTFPVRATAPRVAFEVPLPAGDGPALVSFMAAHIGEEGGAPLPTRWLVNGRPVMEHALRPSHRPVRVRLLVPAAAARATALVELETEARPDPLAGGATGPLLGGPGLTVERLSSPAAIAAAFARVDTEERAEEGQVAVRAAARSMMAAHPGLAPALDIGPGDTPQIAEGWFPPEKWGRTTWCRWSGGEAGAYLGADGRAATANVSLRPGDRRLGPADGELVIEHAPRGGFLAETARVPFALAEDRWTTVTAPVPREAGTVRLTLRVAQLRVPRERLPGSGDGRALGVAVRRFWLA